MPSSPTSLLDLKSYSLARFETLFSKAQQLKRTKAQPVAHGERIALLFFEPSTRTRMSFESAAYRMGLGPMIFDGGVSTSLEKGETIEDSVLNVAAMRPRFLVIRGSDAVDMQSLSQKVDIPILNAGWGIKGHPTQALLDAYTMAEEFGSLKGLRVLILGDIRHSRVAASHLELLPQLGAQIGLCGPDEFLVDTPSVKIFSKLSSALEWAQVAMALRVQFERHQGQSKLSTESYRKDFGLNANSLKALMPQGIVMHPGPINHGIELETEVLSDSRCRVLTQVTNGVFVREALLRENYAN